MITLNKIIIVLIVTTTTFLSVEIFSGYYLYRKITNTQLSLLDFIKSFEVNKKEINLSTKEKLIKNLENPFLKYPPDDKLVKFHPFLDYTNAHGIDLKTNKVKAFDNDFFGFRNTKHNYDLKKDKNTILIVMTGGSECAGYSHPNYTILEKIKEGLQKSTSKNVVIINLCMNSYVLSHEIQSYIHLVYNMKPDIVITHSGWNDVLFGSLISKKFIDKGLIYNKWIELWLEPLYKNLKEYPKKEDMFTVNKGFNSQTLQNAYLELINKYEKIVEANHGKLIVGLQPYDKFIPKDNMYQLHKHVQKELKKISNLISKRNNIIDFTKFPDLSFADVVHTDESAVEIVSDAYVNFIKENLSDLL